MDQEERGKGIETSESLSQVEGVGGNTKNSDNGVVPETVIVINSEENVGFSLENANLRFQNDDFESLKDQEMDNGRGIGQPLIQNDLGSGVNSGNLADRSVLENEETDLGEKTNGVVSSELLMEAREGVLNQETNQMGGVGETTGQVDHESCGSLNNSVDRLVVETIVVVNTHEAACVDGSNRLLEVKDNGLGSSKVLTEKPKIKVAEAEDSCVIDIKGSGGGGGGGGRKYKESWDGESVCRICHLNTEQSLEFESMDSSTAATMDLIQLGCGCKDELGIAHSHCAEAWFKLKGNRMCEICGQTAKNITGVRDNRFIEDWHDQGSTSLGGSSSERGGGCWRGQPFCNFLMACLVIAFVLPWFFRVNMF